MATMICPRAASLRALASTHRTISAVTPKQASFSSSTRPQKQRRLGEPSSRPSIALRIPKHRFAPVTRQSIRHESTSSAYRTPSAPNTASPPSDLLTWDRFFDLRKKRRYINLAASIATATATVAVAGPIIAQQDIDTWGAQVSGLDPFIVLGLTTFAAAAGGWLCGPSFGSAGFGIWAGRRGWNKAIAEKEKSFYARIKRYRADPSQSSPQNPIPDYYGEKIASVKDYRRWLKDQRAFNRKKNRTFGM